MIAHILLFSPRPDLSSADRVAILATLTTAAAEIPGIRRFRVGKRVRHGLPGYEQAMREDFAFLVVIEVDDADALKAYLAHPSTRRSEPTSRSRPRRRLPTTTRSSRRIGQAR